MGRIMREKIQGIGVGCEEGRTEGEAEGMEVGYEVGRIVGEAEGMEVGCEDGRIVGEAEGTGVGAADGVKVGTLLGLEVGCELGAAEVDVAEGSADTVGTLDGLGLCMSVGAPVGWYVARPHSIRHEHGQYVTSSRTWSREYPAPDQA